MTAERSTLRPEARLEWFGTVDDGKRLELVASIEGVQHLLASVVADPADESLWFTLTVNGVPVQVPLGQIRQLVEAAPTEVHSEAWYEKNVYPPPV